MRGCHDSGVRYHKNMTAYIIQAIDSLVPGIPWERSFFGNSAEEYITSFFVLVFSLILFGVFQSAVLGALKRFARKTKTELDDLFIRIVKSIRPPFYVFLALYVSLRFLTLGEFVERAADAVLLVWIAYQAALALQILIDFFVKKRNSLEDDESAKNAFRIGGSVAKWVVWIFAALFVLSNLGIEVTSFIAGLGIGGIAVAFALQNILSDLFSSFAIYFDKPFKVGDFIVVGTHSGTVEKIGIKSTRIKALQGEEVILSNRELTSARVQNFKKLRERRVAFSFGIIYETPTEKMKKIPSFVKDAVKKTERVRFDRCHFKAFGDFALIFETVYFVESDDYAEYMDAQQEINLGIKEVFERESIEMAYPTTTVRIAKE